MIKPERFWASIVEQSSSIKNGNAQYLLGIVRLDQVAKDPQRTRPSQWRADEKPYLRSEIAHTTVSFIDPSLVGYGGLWLFLEVLKV